MEQFILRHFVYQVVHHWKNDDCISEINGRLRYKRAKDAHKIETDRAKFNDFQMFVMEETHYGDQELELEIEISSDAKSDFEIANYIMYHTMLPRLAIFKILQGIEKRELLNNQDILDEITQFILEKLNDAKAENQRDTKHFPFLQGELNVRDRLFIDRIIAGAEQLADIIFAAPDLGHAARDIRQGIDGFHTGTHGVFDREDRVAKGLSSGAAAGGR